MSSPQRNRACTAVRANHPLALRRSTGSRFQFFLSSGVAISAWALFPKTVERGIYVPLPETSTPSAADVKSAREGVGRQSVQCLQVD